MDAIMKKKYVFILIACALILFVVGVIFWDKQIKKDAYTPEFGVCSGCVNYEAYNLCKYECYKLNCDATTYRCTDSQEIINNECIQNCESKFGTYIVADFFVCDCCINQINNPFSFKRCLKKAYMIN